MMSIPKFHHQDLLTTALTHRSALNEHKTRAKESNERLEYLGDAVLELIVTEFLYHKMPNAPEGVLTAIRSCLVKTTTLSEVGQQLGLGELIYMSKGEESGGGRTNEAILADTMEAVIGALYLDQGIEAAKKFVSAVILVKYDEIMALELYKDAKSSLQEQLQAENYGTPEYRVIAESGPDHDKHFVMGVYLGATQLGQGEGRSKQASQQAAAADALAKLADKVVVLDACGESLGENVI